MAKLALCSCLLSATCDPGIASPVVCGPTQILGTDSRRQLVCVVAPNGTVTPPSCAAALTSDGQQLLCAPPISSADKDQDVSAALQQLDGAVLNMQVQLMPALPATGYVGLTRLKTAGDVFYGALEGLSAVAYTCAVQYGPGAHPCMMDELYQSVVNGTLSAATSIAPSWVYMPNWNTPMANPDTPLQGLADNCGSFTYQLSSRRWSGILVEWGPLADGTPGFRWHGGGDAPCGSQHFITCCN